MLVLKKYRLLKTFFCNTNFTLNYSQTSGKNYFKLGDSIKVTIKINQTDVDTFSNLTNDHNPIHKNGLPESVPIVQGAFLNGLVSGVIGTKFPGPGSIVLSQKFSFPNKCLVNKDIDIIVTLTEVRKIITISYECTQDGITVFEGDAKIIQKKIN